MSHLCSGTVSTDIALAHLLSRAVGGAGDSAGLYGLKVERAGGCLWSLEGTSWKVYWKSTHKNLWSWEHGDCLVSKASLPPHVLAAILCVRGEHHPPRCSQKLEPWGRTARVKVETQDGSVVHRDQAVQMHVPLLLGKQAKLIMAKACPSNCA